MTLYVLPVLIFVANAALVAAVIRRSTHRQPTLAADLPPPDTANADDRRRLDDELRDMD